MANNQTNNSEEIDLGQLFKLIGSAFQKLFTAFLRLFLYFKKNALILLGLIIVGAGIGYGLNQIITEKLKTEIIVKPLLESKNYLYDVVNEIQANIEAENFNFFQEIGLEIEDLKGFEINIAPMDAGKQSSESEMKFLELLQSFENTEAVTDIVRAELQNKSSFNHRITFLYKDSDEGSIFAKKVMEYINSNQYFYNIVKINRENAENRITENRSLLRQVDELISNYSKKIAQNENLVGNNRIVLDNDERIDITGLFKLKNILIKDIESKKLELTEKTEAIRIINFGKTHEIQKSFFGKNIVLIPSILFGIFCFFSGLKFINRKADQINKK